ncbi:MAG: PEP-CTERM sorting domain-containing protein [Gammaproteobacteria bacterium]|nr:PEP-CTERM sorting domain-containing protein [Gammaproteobacteria bacterium]MCF6231042.1 PEP-CTERM sorting domain-containing protein [Gammaproteobacteria bacterium]
MKRFLLLIAVLVVGMVGSVNAAPIQYNFQNSGSGSSPSMDFTVDGLTVTITATYNGFSNSADVSRDVHGLGVRNGHLDSSDIDGRWRDDYLTLSFDRAVSLIGFNFAHDTLNDEFDLYVDGISVAHNLETTGGWETFSLGTYVSDSFTIRASEWNDNFVLSGMRVQAVPEPALVFLMGFGLLGMGVMARRRV